MVGFEVKTPYTNRFFISKILGKTYVAVDPTSWGNPVTIWFSMVWSETPCTAQIVSLYQNHWAKLFSKLHRKNNNDFVPKQMEITAQCWCMFGASENFKLVFSICIFVEVNFGAANVGNSKLIFHSKYSKVRCEESTSKVLVTRTTEKHSCNQQHKTINDAIFLAVEEEVQRGLCSAAVSSTKTIGKLNRTLRMREGA